jgi:hypothetical protein
MQIYSNLLPIRFGTEGLLCQRIGFQDGAVEAGTFAHGGARYALPGAETTDASAVRERIDPIDIQEALLPVLTRRLAERLQALGTVADEGDRLLFQPKGDRATCALKVERLHNPGDGKVFRYAVCVTGLNPGSDDYFSVWDAVGVLQDQALLPDGEGVIGAFESLRMPPLTDRRLIFSIDGTQHHSDAKAGLITFGPYSKEKTRDRRLHIAYLDPTPLSGDIGYFLRDLREGIKYPQHAAAIWGRPWKEIFHFHEVVFTPLDPSQVTSIEALDFFFKGKEADGTAVDVLLYVGATPDTHLEADLLSLGIPSHHLPLQTLSLQDLARADALLDTALALYAKCHGEPWLLTQDATLSHEVVVGIGSHTIGTEELGYATVFSSQGNYRLGEASWMPHGMDWLEFFSQLLIRKLLVLERENQWEKYATVHLLLHLDQRIDTILLAGLKERLIARFGDRTALRISFLYLTTAHAYRLWPVVGERGRVPRGSYLQLSPYAAILQLAEGGAPQANPLLLEFLQPSDSQDLLFKLRQVFYFSQMSWHDIRPAELPVTLLYSQLVAAKYAAYRPHHPNLRLPASLDTLPWYL